MTPFEDLPAVRKFREQAGVTNPVTLEWTAEEIEDLLTDAIADSADMDWTARDGARAIMRELAENGLCITWTPARRDLIENPPKGA